MARKPEPSARTVKAPLGFYHDTDQPGIVFESVVSTDAGQGVAIEILQDGKLSIHIRNLRHDGLTLNPAECDKLEAALCHARNMAARIYKKPKIRL